MEESHVVTCFLEHNNKILLLQRSQRVGSYNNRWAGISGYIEPGVTPLDQAYQEIAEEASLHREQVKLAKIGPALDVIDAGLGKKWVVHPFRFQVQNPQLVQIDWEHNEYKWVDPVEVKNYETVPGLYDAWELVK